MSEAKIREYYRLAKPGMVYGNLLPALGGFALGSKDGGFNILLCVFTMISLGLVIASACVFNNYLDRNIDRKMLRTRQRALPQKRIAGWEALTYAATLGVFGLFILIFFIDILAAYVAAAGLFLYVVIYGLAKRHTYHSTEIGSLSGAAPPVVGYLAATSHVDLGAGLLFLTMALWQMPHFYAIAIFRQKDYEAAKLPLMPIKKGIAATKKQMVIYAGAFVLAAASLTATGYTGYAYLAAMIIFGGYWLNMAVQGLSLRDNVIWAKKMFGTSLLVLVVFSLALVFNSLLP